MVARHIATLGRHADSARRIPRAPDLNLSGFHHPPQNQERIPAVITDNYDYGYLDADPLIISLLSVRQCIHAAMDFGYDHDQIEDVEYEELEPDPNDGPAPMATLISSPKK